MPPPLGAGGIMFSGCPSVRPKPEIPSFDLYMGLLVHPTNRDRFTACPSVRPKITLYEEDKKEASMRCSLLHGSWDQILQRRPSVCPSVHLSVRPSGEVSGHLPENAWRKWPEILHADVSWPFSELISLWPQSVDFSNFGTILIGVSSHFLENAWRKWPEILHADVSWPPSELISFWPRSVEFCNFGTILT